MNKALLQAKKALKLGEIPVGVIIVNSVTKKIIAKAHNLVELQNNPILHAEIVAINLACKKLKSKFLTGYDMFSTLEPCIMCSAAISKTQISRLFYAASDLKNGSIENGNRYFTTTSCYHKPEIYPGIFEEQAHHLLSIFFNKIRYTKTVKNKKFNNLIQ